MERKRKRHNRCKKIQIQQRRVYEKWTALEFKWKIGWRKRNRWDRKRERKHCFSRQEAASSLCLSLQRKRTHDMLIVAIATSTFGKNSPNKEETTTQSDFNLYFPYSLNPESFRIFSTTWHQSFASFLGANEYPGDFISSIGLLSSTNTVAVAIVQWTFSSFWASSRAISSSHPFSCSSRCSIISDPFMTFSKDHFLLLASRLGGSL